MKRILSIFISAVLLLSAFSFSAFSLESGNYSYVLEDGKAVITGYSGKETTLAVPRVLDGCLVYAIGDGAFENNKNLVSVTLPEGLCEVRQNAFRSCVKLSQINLPATLLKFGENAVYNTAYYNDKSNWTIRPKDLGSSGGWVIGGGQDTIPWEFIKASELEYLYLGTVLVKCHVVGTYSVKYETTVIADGAFCGETGLSGISLSSKTVTVGVRAFEGCTALSQIEISDECKIYEDALLNTGYYNNPSNWEGDFLVIGTRAVDSKKDAEELTVPDGITRISSGAVGTRDVYISPSVTQIDIDAFSGKKSVIFGYGGSYAQMFASLNGFTFVDLDNILLGDMDFDGDLTSNDYAIYSACVMCTHKMTKYEKIAGDLNLDGTVDGFDAIHVQVLINDKTAKIRGDVNGDGKINDDDYRFLISIVFCECNGVGENFIMRSDLNGDGAVDAFDAIYLDLYLNGRVNL